MGIGSKFQTMKSRVNCVGCIMSCYSRTCLQILFSPFYVAYFIPLLQGMSTEIKCECLDILCDVLHKYGNLMTTDHEVLLDGLLPQLNTNQASVRKKAVSCIGRTTDPNVFQNNMPFCFLIIKLLNNSLRSFKINFCCSISGFKLVR